MSREHVVRQPIAVSARSRRRLEQHLVRFPGLFRALFRVLWGMYVSLPPRSRLRRSIARRTTERTVEAFNRRDLEVAFAAFALDVESIFDHRLVALGFQPVYRGREARIAAQRQWHAEWGEWHLQPDELISLGDRRFLLVGQFGGSGRRSGAMVDAECGFLYTVSAGQIIREQVFFDRTEALEAAGLSES